VGWQNVSAYGLNGLYTNIDRIANEGIMFTDHYALHRRTGALITDNIYEVE
jgi:arylsulfatase A-like enzyme